MTEEFFQNFREMFLFVFVYFTYNNIIFRIFTKAD